MVRSKDRATPPTIHYVLIPREIMRETTRQLCPRAAKQQAGVDRKRERSFSGLSARGTWHVARGKFSSCAVFALRT